MPPHNPTTFQSARTPKEDLRRCAEYLKSMAVLSRAGLPQYDLMTEVADRITWNLKRMEEQ